MTLTYDTIDRISSIAQRGSGYKGYGRVMKESDVIEYIRKTVCHGSSSGPPDGLMFNIAPHCWPYDVQVYMIRNGIAKIKVDGETQNVGVTFLLPGIEQLFT
jgi:hypothetical protein